MTVRPWIPDERPAVNDRVLPRRYRIEPDAKVAAHEGAQLVE